jgi:hypothetical protein
VRRLARGARVPADVLARAALPRGERVLVSAAAEDGGWLLATRDALLVVGATGSRRVPWQDVETADWDRDAGRLRVVEVGDFGRPRPVHEFALAEPGLLLATVRERVTASVVLQRRAAVSGRLGLTVVARRPPGGGEPTWAVAYDAGVDPDDPAVRLVAEEALAAARAEIGDQGGQPLRRPAP